MSKCRRNVLLIHRKNTAILAEFSLLISRFVLNPSHLYFCINYVTN